MDLDILSYCQSMANKTAMIMGAISFKNVMALLTAETIINPVATGIYLPRLAAMVVQSATM